MTAPLKSVLFAPGTRPDVLRKLPRSRPDGAVIDLEDAVPPAAKAEARLNARVVAPELIAMEGGPAVFVRINAVAGDWFSADVAESLVTGLAGVFVPKLESAAHVDMVRDALDRAGHPELAIGAGVETAVGVHRVDEVFGAGVQLAYFGAEDFIADMGGVRRSDNREVLYARSRVALAARVAGVPLLDMVVTDFGDEERFRAEAAEARSLGYVGKLCIHPSQVALANEAFVPTPEEVDRARRIVAAYDEAVSAGHAALSVDGQMVDEPLARRARIVLDQAGTGQPRS